MTNIHVDIKLFPILNPQNNAGLSANVGTHLCTSETTANHRRMIILIRSRKTSKKCTIYVRLSTGRWLRIEIKRGVVNRQMHASHKYSLIYPHHFTLLAV